VISTPGDYPRAYICDRCIRLCVSILRDDTGEFKKIREGEQAAEALRCSFCHKTWGPIENLISSPADTPSRVCICDECIAVCVSIVDDRYPPVTGPFEPKALIDRPLTAPLLAAIDRWIGQESLGKDATEELAAVRKIASFWVKRGP
jgi:ATP-dependent protease Clp ATPase subunit